MKIVDTDASGDPVVIEVNGLRFSRPTHPASGEAVSCFHEAYQGFCAHCGVKIVNGRAQVHAATPSPDKLKIAIEALEKIAGSAGEHGERGTTGDGHQQAIQDARAALSALKGEGT